MSSINPHYTLEYVQPEEYHFSHDSVFFARKVFEYHAAKLSPTSEVLDLCAGCGIIGLDFLYHCRKELNLAPKICDFVEVQKIYESYFTQNVQTFGPTTTQIKLIISNYAHLDPQKQRYDLILCNPPYFRTDQGKLSPSEFKNRCRFFIDSDFETLLTQTTSLLKPRATAYLLMRDQLAHRQNILQEAQHILGTQVALNIVDDVRGTHLVEIKNLG
ncbi:MAG: methyltransferase [Bdellovibrionales bacterium]